jgi:hypothetical protein
MDRAVEIARRSGHGYSLVLALCYAAAFHVAAEDLPRARDVAERAALRAREERLPSHQAFAELMRAATLPKEEGRLAAMLAALGSLPASDGPTPRVSGATGVRALFAHALAEVGQRELALAQVAEAFSDALHSGERHQLPSLHLLRASLVGTGSAALHELEQALAEAAAQGNRVAEVAAATELARLELEDGRRGAAVARLEELVEETSREPDVPLLARARAVLRAPGLT